MPRRHAELPHLWLMTDTRQGEALWDALARLPRGSGVVFRHYGAPARRVLYERVRAIARARRLTLLLAGDVRIAVAWRADGVHGRSRRRAPPRMIRSAPVHSSGELAAAADADLLFVSPVFATRSHPGVRPLGRIRLGLLAGADRDRMVALGGMTRARARSLASLGIERWAAIDGLTGRAAQAGVRT